ncbi:MAG TPA: PQQ-binding-like beta-propeller repeat protein [Holophagaceae bacterium]|nr:PQQ-binding-like beta-propeller repeat protein [Holophagaceae bacterium]
MRLCPTSLVLGLSALAAIAQVPAPMQSLGPSWQAQWLLRARLGQGNAAFVPARSWKVTTDQSEIPAAFDGTRLVLVNASPKKVLAVDPLTGSTLWEVPFTGLLDIPPQIAGNRVIFALEGGRLGVLDAATGALRNLLSVPAWKSAKGGSPVPKPRLLFPAVAGDTLVVGWHTPAGEQRPEQGLFAFDLNTGVLRWSSALPGASELHPLILGNRVLVGGGGQVTTFDLATGRGGWIAKTPKRSAFESCQLIEDRLFLRTLQEVFALDPVTGQILWSQEAQGNSLLIGSGDRLLFTAPRGTFNPTTWIVAFNSRTGEKAWEWEAEGAHLPWILNGRVVLNTNAEVLSLDLATGAPLWRRELGGALSLPLQVRADAILAVHRAKGGARIVALRPADGSEASAAQIKEKIGAGLIHGGPKSVLLPLAEGGVVAF